MLQRKSTPIKVVQIKGRFYKNVENFSGFPISLRENKTNKYSDTVNTKQPKLNATRYAYREINVATKELFIAFAQNQHTS